MFILKGTLIGIIKSGAEREVKLIKKESFYEDEHGNLWDKINGYSDNDMAVWKLDTTSVEPTIA